MDFEVLTGIAGVLHYWRALLCLVASSVLAFVLVSVSPWLSVAQGFVIALLGFIPGSILEERAAGRHVRIKTPAQQTPILVGILSAIACGGIWGAASAMPAITIISGALMMIIAQAIWYWYFSYRTHRIKSNPASLFLAIASSSFAFAVTIRNLI